MEPLGDRSSVSKNTRAGSAAYKAAESALTLSNNATADAAEHGDRAVTAAVVGNTAVVLAKLAGWGATGSGALLSEAFHSMADLGNQLMLAFGLERSMRAADTAHPYGYGFEQYVWAMVRLAAPLLA